MRLTRRTSCQAAEQCIRHSSSPVRCLDCCPFACKAVSCQACLFVQANLYPRILAAMKPGATLGLSHGFLLGVLKNDGVDFRDDINVVLVAPKVNLSPVTDLCVYI